MSWVVRSLGWISLLLMLAGCKSMSSGRKDIDERRSEVQLSLYVTERANPNPNAPIESDPERPPIRIELSGATLEDMAAQLAAMAKLIEQERKLSGSVRPAPVATQAPNANTDSNPPAGEDVAKIAAAKRTADSAPTDSTASALPGLPPTAVLEQRASTPPPGDDEPVRPRLLGTYRGDETGEAESGTVTLGRAKPSPLAIQVVQLSDDSLLLNADYDSLATDLKKTLGSTYLRHDDYVIKPGQYKTVPLRKLDKDALYLGVIAAYHESDLRRWKAVYRLSSTVHRYGVLMVFDEAGATIGAEEQ